MPQYQDVLNSLRQLCDLKLNFEPPPFPNDRFDNRQRLPDVPIPTNGEDEGIVDFILPKSPGQILQPMESRYPVAHNAAEFLRYVIRDKPGVTQAQIDNSANFVEDIVESLVAADPTIAGVASELASLLGFMERYWLPHLDDTLQYRHRDPQVGRGGAPRDEDDYTVTTPINELHGERYDRMLDFLRFIIQVRGLEFPEPPRTVRPNRRDEWLPPRPVRYVEVGDEFV